MNDDQVQILALPTHPARLTFEQVALVLNFAPHDIAVLVRAKLLRPLGNPRKSAVKYFAAVEVNRLAQDRSWLAKATDAIYDFWQWKSALKKKALAESGLAKVPKPSPKRGVSANHGKPVSMKKLNQAELRRSRKAADSLDPGAGAFLPAPLFSHEYES